LFNNIVKQHYGMAVLIYIFFYAVVITVSLPVTWSFGIVGRFMFGFSLALFYSIIIGNFLRALVAFSLVRRMTTRLRRI